VGRLGFTLCDMQSIPLRPQIPFNCNCNHERMGWKHADLENKAKRDARESCEEHCNS
jgi:hypothetical protein